MKITKYEHACLVIEDAGKKLVIDPGKYAESLPQDLKDVTGIVITHVHQDHFNHSRVENLLNNNPGAEICSTQQVADEMKSHNIHVVNGGLGCKAGTFQLEFFGGQHAIVHPSIPVDQNVGVLVNGRFYYPGDSFVKPEDHQVEVLAVPSGGPWMKTSEAMDFLVNVNPQQAFPTHNIHLSTEGQKLADWLIGEAAAKVGIDYLVLATLESTEV